MNKIRYILTKGRESVDLLNRILPSGMSALPNGSDGIQIHALTGWRIQSYTSIAPDWKCDLVTPTGDRVVTGLFSDIVAHFGRLHGHPDLGEKILNMWPKYENKVTTVEPTES